MPGSIIVVNSVGSATTYTGISTQINSIKTGGINTSNITGGSQPITIFKPDEVGFKTSNIPKSPAHVVGSVKLLFLEVLVLQLHNGKKFLLELFIPNR